MECDVSMDFDILSPRFRMFLETIPQAPRTHISRFMDPRSTLHRACVLRVRDGQFVCFLAGGFYGCRLEGQRS